MKHSIKSLIAVGLLAAGFYSPANAALHPTDTHVYITGSSAFRGAVVNAIGHILNSPTAAYTGTSGVAGGNQQLITGFPTAASGLPTGTRIWFHTSWSGSIAGITALTYSLNIATFLTDDSSSITPVTMTVGSGNDSASGAGGGVSVSGPFLTARAADAAFSDVFQSSTKYKSPELTEAGSAVIGVVPFVWVGNPDTKNFTGASGGKVTNVSATIAKQLLVGAVNICQFTGNDNDQAAVLPVGRNADSGTRFTAFAETGFNPVNGAALPPQQYAVSTSGASVLVSKYPAETLFSGTPAATSYTAGQSGYGSGGNVATAMKINGTSTATTNASYLITYVGESDASNIVTGGGVYLNYNGTAYGSLSGASTQYNRLLLQEGSYTFWGYEHLYYTPGNAQAAVLDVLGAQVRDVDAPIAGEKMANMAVQRNYEGGPIYYVGRPTP